MGRWDTIHVPKQNGIGNNTINDVIGNKSDTHDGNSIYSKLEILDDHIHKPALVYPTLADGVTVTSSASAWTLGSFVEIIPVSTITEDFDIHYVMIESFSGDDVYELVLYAATVEIGRVRFTRSIVFQATLDPPFQCAIQSANTQIQAKLACAGGLSKSVDISLFYHEY